MSDLLIAIPTGPVDPLDLEVADGGLVTTDGLGTAVLVSLWTDRRGGDDDALTDPDADRRGWWADSYTEIPGDRIGSRLWLLDRAHAGEDTRRRWIRYAEEALAWMIDDGIASRIEVTASWTAGGTLLPVIQIFGPDGEPAARIAVPWQATMEGE